ncbi:MAG TPA: hypothetical protein VL126_06775 [Bacteroidota bacterium]|nr:hypothetical protein [Bacteroidota bacterium]
MIPMLVFYIHVVALAAGFTKRYQEEGVAEGFLAVFFMALIFFVGWGIASFLLKLVMRAEGFGPAFNRDAAGLVLLTVGESVFYYYFLLREDSAVRDKTNSSEAHR